MRRREFLSGVGGIAVGWPFAAGAQQQPMPVIGLLHSASPGPYAERMAAFRQGLADTGYVEGASVAIEYRWAEGRYERMPAAARDLVERGVSVIVAAGGVVSGPIAKAATATIPIVFVTGADPVATGLVASFARPGGNATGVHMLTQVLGAKRLGLLNVLAPDAATIAMLVNPANPGTQQAVKDTQAAGRASLRQVRVLEARTVREIDAAFETMRNEKLGALLVHSDPFFTSRRAQIAALGNDLAVPAIYPSREYAEAGGIMSYGADVRDEYRKAGVYTGRILRGAKPAELPVLQPTRFELVVNLRTAKSLGLKVSESFLLLADEVIE